MARDRPATYAGEICNPRIRSGSAGMCQRRMHAEFGASKSGVLRPDNACTSPQSKCLSPIPSCVTRSEYRIESRKRVWDSHTWARDVPATYACRIWGPRIRSASAGMCQRLMHAEFEASKSEVFQPDNACTSPQSTCLCHIPSCLTRFEC